ncbi:glycosyltransferase family 4 protein [Iodobacter fluviatilis]|uniref:Glycogen synthase n=1 Tax=Iodobacter fluviatilis TaxID=537 RepID=A0A377Q5A8_9NEIS|nr:glycosyltransferase family 4 protein [Iodobacter fluviatilis]TCU87092.1 glycosyltransferase involved in cell wall biosynthesis [Iodobacter fluviatilis]STQ90424.1 Glycogen synthase [Iodobacter fluviatilis]
MASSSDRQAAALLASPHRSLNILWTLPYLPWPTTSGGKLRQYHLLRALAHRGHRITLLVQSKERLTPEVKAQIERIVDRLIVLPRRPLRHPLTLAAAAFAPYPLLASVNGFASRLERVFAALLEGSWDVIQIEHSYGLQPFLRQLQVRKQPFLLTEHNVESSLGAATYQQMPAWMRPFIRFDQWRYRLWEKRVLSAACCVAAVTAEDAERLAKIGQRAVDVVINGVDTAAFAHVWPNLNSQRILFIGNFEYPPNRDAVVWSLDEIMPEVWAAQPDARFVICGYAMPDAWRTRWPDSRIEWCGFVPDLTLEQQKSALFLAPLREGGGSKLKVLEALAAGLPLVSTPQGVSGLALQAGQHYRVGQTAAELALAVIRLLNQGEDAREMAEAGRLYACQNNDWQISASQLETLYQKVKHADRN